MFYDFELIVPAGTTQAAPAEETLQLTQGVVHTFRLYVPPGPRGEVHVVIMRGDHQVYPSNPESTFNVDNVYIQFDDHYELLSEPYTFVARGWSPSASYDHTVRIEIGLFESTVGLAGLKILLGLQKLLKALGVKW